MVSVKDRVSTGVEKLDLLMGGFPKGRTVLVTGDAGTCKTIFGLQFAQTCCKAGLKTVYCATEEDIDDLMVQAKSFGWDCHENVKKGMMTFIELAASRVEGLETTMSINIAVTKGEFETLLAAVPKGTEALVIDSLGSHTADLTPRSFKDRLEVLVHKLNMLNITTLLILDSATSHEYNDLALFSVNGAILMMKRENPYTGRRERAMDIVKMRNTSTPIQLLTFDITAKGIDLIKSDEGAQMLGMRKDALRP